jgi:hypothetical protein
METHRTKRTGGCVLADGFSVWEKTFAQLSFWAMGIAGTVGIVLADWPWVLPYVAVYWYGVPGLVMRHLNCPRCPHLWEYGDCLQAPVALTRWLIKGEVPFLHDFPSHPHLSNILAGVEHDTSYHIRYRRSHVVFRSALLLLQAVSGI